MNCRIVVVYQHCSAEGMRERTLSTPMDFKNSSLFVDADAVTVHPAAFAICAAKMPTDVLPPLMNTLCPGSNFARLNKMLCAVMPASVNPAASTAETLGERGSAAEAGMRMYSASEPWW